MCNPSKIQISAAGLARGGRKVKRAKRNLSLDSAHSGVLLFVLQALRIGKNMIRGFRHKGLEKLYFRGEAKGVRADHVKKLRQILAVLGSAEKLEDIQSVQPLRCHSLTGVRKHEHAVWVNKNWRVTFEFRDGDAYILNYEDYH